MWRAIAGFAEWFEAGGLFLLWLLLIGNVAVVGGAALVEFVPAASLAAGLRRRYDKWRASFRTVLH